MLEIPFSEVRTFIKRQRAVGRYKKNTALSREAACAQIAGILEPGKDSVGYVKDHLDELVKRYSNLNSKVGKKSLNAYGARVMRSIDDFISHKTDPNWAPRTRDSKPGSRPKPPSVGASDSSPAIRPVERSTTSDPAEDMLQKHNAASANALRHRLPLRADFDVEILLPRDFTLREAKRVTTWIAAVASAFTDEEPG